MRLEHLWIPVSLLMVLFGVWLEVRNDRQRRLGLLWNQLTEGQKLARCVTRAPEVRR
jgi:hypothetical protein